MLKISRVVWRAIAINTHAFPVHSYLIWTDCLPIHSPFTFILVPCWGSTNISLFFFFPPTKAWFKSEMQCWCCSLQSLFKIHGTRAALNPTRWVIFQCHHHVRSFWRAIIKKSTQKQSCFLLLVKPLIHVSILIRSKMNEQGYLIYQKKTSHLSIWIHPS